MNLDNSPLQTFTNSKPVVEPVDVCWVWIVQYLKHASFHFAALNSLAEYLLNVDSQLCFAFATLKKGMAFHPYLENKVFIFINQFHATGLFLQPLKRSENKRFPDVCRGHRKRPVTRSGLSKIISNSFPAIQISIKINISPRVTKLIISLEVLVFPLPVPCSFISDQGLYTL